MSQSTDGGQAGVRLDWSQWLNDHWQYQLQYNSQADIPLQAIDAGEDGQSYRAALTWQKDESRQIGASYGLTDIVMAINNKNFQLFGAKDYLQRRITLLMALSVVFSAVIAKIKLLILAQVRITAQS